MPEGMLLLSSVARTHDCLVRDLAKREEYGADELPARIVGEAVEIRWLEFEPGLEERRVVGGGAA